MTDDKVSRGYWSIKEVVDYLKPLAAWFEQNRPSVRNITLRGRDYDLVARWPKAAEQHGFSVRDGVMQYGSITLTRDKGRARYDRKDAA